MHTRDVVARSNSKPKKSKRGHAAAARGSASPFRAQHAFGDIFEIYSFNLTAPAPCSSGAWRLIHSYPSFSFAYREPKGKL